MLYLSAQKQISCFTIAAKYCIILPMRFHTRGVCHLIQHSCDRRGSSGFKRDAQFPKISGEPRLQCHEKTFGLMNISIIIILYCLRSSNQIQQKLSKQLSFNLLKVNSNWPSVNQQLKCSLYLGSIQRDTPRLYYCQSC